MYKYPLKFRFRLDPRLIVEFTGLKVGTVISDGNDFYDTGAYSEEFTPHTDTLTWELIAEPFLKDDTTKNRLDLIDPEFILGLGRIMTFGANKYSPNNWKLANSEESQDRIKAALLRHIRAYLSGDKVDPETGDSHLYHAAFGLQALAYFDRINGVGK